MRRAFINPSTGVLKAHGHVATNDPGDVALSVEEDFDLQPGLWRWDGNGWLAYKPPPVPRPRQFRSALLVQLDGVDRAAKLARAQALRERSPGLTEPFLMALSGPALSADEADIIVAIWSRIRALVGTPGEVLTAAEISRIEALAPTYLIRLV